MATIALSALATLLALLPGSSVLAEPPDAIATARLVSRIDEALERATAFLLKVQSPDGAWRSTAYSALGDGRALTPIVLSAILFGPASAEMPSAYTRGSDFVAKLAGPDGALEAGPYGLDYPVYTLSGALLVLSIPVNERHEKAKEALITHLRARQLVESRGWRPSDPMFGGWGYFRALPQKPKAGKPDQLLTSNLTSTLFAVGALQLAGVGLEDPLFKKALLFVKRCQNFTEGSRGTSTGDGGFIFTPTDDIPNKAGPARGSATAATGARAPGRASRYRSYGTVTADGLRALLRLGVSRSDPRVQAASAWLFERFTADRIPGDYLPDREVQRESAYFYWSWTAAHALMLYGPETEQHSSTRGWAVKLAEAVLSRQGQDGAWRNRSVDQREDDPLVATPLAYASLAVCRLMLGGHFRTSIPM